MSYCAVHLLASAGLDSAVYLWNVWSSDKKKVRAFLHHSAPVKDVKWSKQGLSLLSCAYDCGKRFISSSDVSGRNISENAVMREVPLSNQVYVEAYTCPCIKRHPQDPIFIAQSHGNYTAIFSTNLPFKLNKYKRYEGHWVAGFPIKCNFRPDGETLVSGSSDGSIYMYNYKSPELKKLKAYEQPCIDVAYHPVLPNVIASCSWNGQVSVFE